MKKINLDKPENKVYTLDNAINFILDLKEKGENLDCQFYGYTFNTQTATVDSVYKTITGKTKNEYLQEKENMIKWLKQEYPNLMENITNNKKQKCQQPLNEKI